MNSQNITKQFFRLVKESNVDHLKLLKSVNAFEVKGFDINTLDEDGFRALHIAYDNGSLNTFKFLLENGASPNFDIGDNLSFLQCTMKVYVESNDENKSLQWVKALIEAGAEIRKSLFPIVSSNCLELIDILLENGLDINQVNDNGHTPLSMMVTINPEKDTKVYQTIVHLLEKGADPDFKDINSKTFYDYKLNPDLLELLKSYSKMPEPETEIITMTTTQIDDDGNYVIEFTDDVLGKKIILNIPNKPSIILCIKE